jgi:hypothetical protein
MHPEKCHGALTSSPSWGQATHPSPHNQNPACTSTCAPAAEARMTTNQPRNGSPEATPGACTRKGSNCQRQARSTKQIHAFSHPDITWLIHRPLRNPHPPSRVRRVLFTGYGVEGVVCDPCSVFAATGGASRHRARDLLGAGRRRPGLPPAPASGRAGPGRPAGRGLHPEGRGKGSGSVSDPVAGARARRRAAWRPLPAVPRRARKARGSAPPSGSI